MWMKSELTRSWPSSPYMPFCSPPFACSESMIYTLEQIIVIHLHFACKPWLQSIFEADLQSWFEGKAKSWSTGANVRVNDMVCVNAEALIDSDHVARGMGTPGYRGTKLLWCSIMHTFHLKWAFLSNHFYLSWQSRTHKLKMKNNSTRSVLKLRFWMCSHNILTIAENFYNHLYFCSWIGRFCPCFQNQRPTTFEEKKWYPLRLL